MLGFLLRRLGDVIPTFFGVTILVFLMIHLIPSDPIQMRAGERSISPERYAELQKEYGFDRPLVVQYFDYLGGVLQGDLGESFVTKRPVIEEFATRSNCPSRGFCLRSLSVCHWGSLPRSTGESGLTT